MSDKIALASLPSRCVAHGLRKAAARRLAEAGCTTKEIAAITGHRTLSEIERYTKAADQKRLALAAIDRLEARIPNEKFPNLHCGLGKTQQKDNEISGCKRVWRSRQGLNPQPPRSKRGTLSS
jgi:hypothetical protein